MDRRCVVLLALVVGLGCNPVEEARRQAVENNLKQLEIAMRNYEQHQGPSVDKIVDGANQFAIDLYQQLRSTEGNLFFSPSSISTALAMAYAGAAGQTATEMATTLHFPASTDELQSGMRTLQTLWFTSDEKSGIQLRLANRLWGQQGCEFSTRFLAITRDDYQAELTRLDFAKSEQARQTINAWVEQQTEHKITDLIPPSVLSSDTRLVLTNAVYFHGDWTKPFAQAGTSEQDFHLTSSDKQKVPLMHQSAGLRYGAVDDLQVLELPYGDGRLSMVVLLPNEIDGLGGLEAQFSSQHLQQWIASLHRVEEVEVYLPKFKTTSQFQLASTLSALGMPSAFDANTADFSGMTGGKDLYFSAVLHKAFVDVNEEGTEAAAATGMVAVPPRRFEREPQPPPVFRADHPFLFLIRDHRTGAILFFGRMIDPLK